jgi:sugar phosphate isomerase/epimerase
VIEVGCQTYSLRTRPTGEMLTCVRKAGFRSVELWAGHAAHAGGPAGAARIRRTADDVGVALRAYSAGGFVRVAAALVEARLASAFDFAAALGVDLVTGVVDRRVVPIVDALCRRTGLRFAIENHWYADFARAADYFDVLPATSPLVGVTLDTGHLTVAGERPAEAFAALGARVFDVHLKDVVVPGRLQRWFLRRPRMEARTVGTGDGALAPFLSALRHAGYQGCIVIEDERPELPLSELHESLRAATALLRQNGRQPVWASS